MELVSLSSRTRSSGTQNPDLKSEPRGLLPGLSAPSFLLPQKPLSTRCSPCLAHILNKRERSHGTFKIRPGAFRAWNQGRPIAKRALKVRGIRAGASEVLLRAEFNTFDWICCWAKKSKSKERFFVTLTPLDDKRVLPNASFTIPLWDRIPPLRPD